MDLFCSCPDSAQLCKHLAAVLYGVGARLARSPELFFTLRSVKMAELVVRARPRPMREGPAAGELESLFGIEIDRAPGIRKVRKRSPAGR